MNRCGSHIFTARIALAAFLFSLPWVKSKVGGGGREGHTPKPSLEKLCLRALKASTSRCFLGFPLIIISSSGNWHQDMKVCLIPKTLSLKNPFTYQFVITPKRAGVGLGEGCSSRGMVCWFSWYKHLLKGNETGSHGSCLSARVVTNWNAKCILWNILVHLSGTKLICF